VERFFASYVIRGMQPVKMDKIHNTGHTKAGDHAEQREFSFIACGDEKMALPFCKTVWKFPSKFSIFLSNNPAIMLFSVYPNELKLMST
jgi:hypothetical protein